MISFTGERLAEAAGATAFADGAARYRFLSGRHEYKLRFANRDAGHESVLVTGPVLARLATWGVSAARRLPDPVRAQLHRLAH